MPKLSVAFARPLLQELVPSSDCFGRKILKILLVLGSMAFVVAFCTHASIGQALVGQKATINMAVHNNAMHPGRTTMARRGLQVLRPVQSWQFLQRPRSTSFMQVMAIAPKYAALRAVVAPSAAADSNDASASDSAGAAWCTELAIEGMVCEKCVDKVRSTLAAIDGVVSVDVSMENQVARVCMSKSDPTSMTPMLCDAVEDTGFGASPKYGI
eukprot:gnl/MRDRNA2_/MRDRNA2_162305_c0_seq1.p1 gnl/MRDRNA2_/MRDRNA2_162305_c0~~gnl/MRDRNA2_/MRDRNA2_162305_c0_seq1.p1  ORF type:complete len:213 (-),score=33.30 gnl/MRDRNA2_/MRDRNA2_162305_c0_seq1:57-695(-)